MDAGQPASSPAPPPGHRRPLVPTRRRALGLLSVEAVAALAGGTGVVATQPRPRRRAWAVVVQEFLPLLAARGVRTSRFALYG